MKHNENVAFGKNRERLDMSSEEVKKYSLSFMDDPNSKILLVIAEKENGDLLVNIFDRPNRKVYNLLAQALESYDITLKLKGV